MAKTVAAYREVVQAKIEELPAGTIVEIQTANNFYVLAVTDPASREAVIQGGLHYPEPVFVEGPEYFKLGAEMKFYDDDACPLATSDIRSIAVIFDDQKRACAIIGLAYLLSKKRA